MSTTIAYLAPEIPGLSTTFVHNEILALEKHGIEILPVSVRFPEIVDKSPKLALLISKVNVLYDGKYFGLILHNLAFLTKHTFRYFYVLSLVIRDILQLGPFALSSYKLFYQFTYASKLASILKINNCKHLHIHFAHTPTQIGMYSAELVGIKFTFTAHANDLFAQGRLLKEKVERSSGVAVISEFNRKFLISQNVDPNKIHIIRCGIEISDKNIVDFKGFQSPLVLGSLARLVPKKGMDDLIKAFSKVILNHKNCKLRIAGYGDQELELIQLVKKLALSDHVFFEGQINQESIEEWYSGIDIFVLACKSDKNNDIDGIPVVLMEAMASGTPCISTNVSGIPELIIPNVTGSLAESDNPTSLAKTIETLIYQDIGTTHLYIHNAKNMISNEFSRNVNILRLRKLFCI